LSGQIRGFCDSDKDKRAWDRFVSGAGGVLTLTDAEVRDIVDRSENYKNVIDQHLSDCEAGGYWITKKETIGRSELDPEDPWAVAIGTLHETKVDTGCCGKCLYIDVSIEDEFDFNIIALRDPIAEAKTIMVRASQLACGWVDFTHKGSASYKKGSGCR